MRHSKLGVLAMATFVATFAASVGPLGVPGLAPSPADGQCYPITLKVWTDANYGGLLLQACPNGQWDGSDLRDYATYWWDLDGWNDSISSHKLLLPPSDPSYCCDSRADFYAAINYGTFLYRKSTNGAAVNTSYVTDPYNDVISSIRLITIVNPGP